MTKSFGRVCFGREERLKEKKSLNGKFRETKTKAPLGFPVVCVTAGGGGLLLEALDPSQALSSSSSQFHFHTLAGDSGVPCVLLSYSSSGALVGWETRKPAQRVDPAWLVPTSLKVPGTGGGSVDQWVGVEHVGWSCPVVREVYTHSQCLCPPPAPLQCSCSGLLCVLTPPFPPEVPARLTVH